jgi:hypothetical protein
LWKGDLTIIETTVESCDYCKYLTSNNFDNNLDILVLDVDGIDTGYSKLYQKNLAG